MVIEQILETFLSESEDLMREIESQLLRLETETNDEEAINALFRAIHTLKGSAGMVGINNIEQFLHWVENVMEKVRTKNIDFDEDLADLLLKAYDHLGILVDNINKSENQLDPEVQKMEESIVVQLQGYLPQAGSKPSAPNNDPVATDIPPDEGKASRWHISMKFGENTFRFGFDPTSFITHLNQMGDIISLSTDTNRIPSADIMDPESCYLTVEIDYLCEFEKSDIEDVFEFLADDIELSIIPSQPKIERYVKNLEEMVEETVEPVDDTHKIGEILVNSGAVTEKELSSALQQQQSTLTKENGNNRIGDILIEEGAVDSKVVETALEVQKPIKAIKEKASKTIRIETGKLDQFIDLVGELVISSAGIMQQSEAIKNKELIETAAINSRLVGEIREQIMSLRMVPVQETFNRFHRVVREINKESGKKISLDIRGGDAELDKTVIEKIFDPLMHLVRNAADHGIESPEIRKEKGKNEEGTITLRAYHDAGTVVIEITDDGAGLNRDKLLQKAIKKGDIPQNHDLTDQEILNLIFTPGLSTAKTVTKLSGRGVGMDVVKSNIEALRGTVNLESVEGEGTTVRITLPLTMAIIEGLLVGVGDSKYVIPLETVVECIDLPEDALKSTHRHVNLRGKPLPFVWLREVFEEDGPQSDEQSIVVIKLGQQSAGLVTDVLYGEIQAVMKNLDEVYQDVPGISGATILGDGRVCLILDIKGLIELAEDGFSGTQKSKTGIEDSEIKNSKDTEVETAT